MNFELKRWFGDSIMIYTVDNHEAMNKKIKKLIQKAKAREGAADGGIGYLLGE